MKILIKVTQVLFACFITFMLIKGFNKLEVVNSNLNKIENYSIVTNEDIKVEEVNEFLNSHSIEYELNYEQAKEALHGKLMYYSFWEKANNVSYKSKDSIDIEQTLEDVQVYYDNLSSEDQKQFNSYLDNAIKRLVGAGDESNETI